MGENVLISTKASIYEPEKITIGNNVRIDDFCVLSGNINIGNYVHIACHVIMTATVAPIYLGDYSTLSYGVKVFSATDDFVGPFFSNPTVKNELRNVTHAAVRIGQKCAVGAGSVLMPGVELNDGVSLGALSLAKGILREWSVYGGIPANFLRSKPFY